MGDRETAVVKVTKEECLEELLMARRQQMGIEDIEKDDSA